MNKTIFKSTLIMLFIVFTLGTMVFAQDANPPTISDDEVNAIAKQLYCPVCENIPLDVCGTQACAQWRELIRDKIAEGWGEDEIKEYFVVQYGDRVLAEPPRRGLNWLVYIVPPVAFMVGVYILFRGIQSWRKVTALDSAESEYEVEQLDDYVARMEEDLRRSDQ
jgi:cytochrome c-type biogenesis protein CcmH